MVEKKGNKSNILKAICLALILGAIPILVWFLTNRSETIITEDTVQASVSALQCSSNKSEDAFFLPEKVQRYEHKIKVLFKNDAIDAISYNYEGTYSSNNEAEDEMSKFYADYNIYMVSQNLDAQSLSPNLSAVKTKVTISLYADRKKMNSGTLPIFFLDGEDLEKIEKFGEEEFEEYYKNKGFSCTFKE